MKLAVGVHISDGPTFNELAHADIHAELIEKKEGEQPVCAVNTLDIMAVLAGAIGEIARQIEEGPGRPVEDLTQAAEWASATLCGLSARISAAILSHADEGEIQEPAAEVSQE